MNPVILLLIICTLFLHGDLSVNAATTRTVKVKAAPAGHSALSSPSIQITGDKNFITKTKAALKLLQEKAPDAYKITVTYIGRIQQHNFSGMAAYETPPTYKVGASTVNASLTWYASTIAHDAYHSKLYHDYVYTYKEAVPNEVWTGMDAEMKCLEIQIQALESMGASASEIEYARSLRGKNWWDLNGDGDYNEDDEKIRDW
jgi:hypothetical protein